MGRERGGGVVLGLGLGGALRNPLMCTWHLFSSDRFATSAALAEVCTVLSTILILM